MKNIEKFLKKLGLKAATITKLTGDEELKDDEFTSIISDYNTTFRDALVNDPEFIDPIKAEITGKERSLIEGKIKKMFGLTAEEVKDKKLDDIVGIAHGKVKSAGDATTQQLQEQITALANENKTLKEVDLPAAKAEAESRIGNYRKTSGYMKKLGSRKLVVENMEAILPAVEALLHKDYDISINDKDEFDVFNKGTKVKPLTADKTRTLEFDEIFDGVLNTMKLIKQSDGGPPPPPTPQGPGERTVTRTLPGMAAAEQNVKDMQNIRQFGQ